MVRCSTDDEEGEKTLGRSIERGLKKSSAWKAKDSISSSRWPPTRCESRGWKKTSWPEVVREKHWDSCTQMPEKLDAYICDVILRSTCRIWSHYALRLSQATVIIIICSLAPYGTWFSCEGKEREAEISLWTCYEAESGKLNLTITFLMWSHVPSVQIAICFLLPLPSFCSRTTRRKKWSRTAASLFLLQLSEISNSKWPFTSRHATSASAGLSLEAEAQVEGGKKRCRLSLNVLYTSSSNAWYSSFSNKTRKFRRTWAEDVMEGHFSCLRIPRRHFRP